VSVTAPAGFVAAGVACGVKSGGDPDLALVATVDRRAVPAAAVTTVNKATAAPVLVTRAHLEASGGRAAAVVLNSGNANAATGEPGRADAERMCASVAEEVGCRAQHVLVCSTGLIGIPLPMEVLSEGIPVVARSLRPEGGGDAAEAILTTDTVRKEVVVEGAGFTVGGMAKGAAMLAPNMATMLAVLTTDAAANPEALGEALRRGVADSFNALSIDGCTSTNDTVVLLASGRAGTVDTGALELAVADACADLAAQMAGDAEGATKVVRITVTGAASDDDAARAARRVAESQLCKCSWYGEDPYWGRILSEVGSAGIAYDHDRASVAYGGIPVCRAGVAATHDAGVLAEVMAAPQIDIDVELGLGDGRGTILTNDLTHAYVDENMGTS
jgi:glutamate N-acetyltransferase / amino-acid N-acetyltransferase